MFGRKYYWLAALGTFFTYFGGLVVGKDGPFLVSFVLVFIGIFIASNIVGNAADGN